MNIDIGTINDKSFSLDLKTLKRHFACFGSSGSGKTVAGKIMIEELAMKGIPVIAFDPQGDIASLALPDNNDNGKHYKDCVEVLIWTPGSSKGLPICINPLQFNGINKLSQEDQTRFLSATAKNIINLLGYDITLDDGKSAEIILMSVFDYSVNHDIKLNGFDNVISILQDLPDKIQCIVSAVSTDKFLKSLIKKLTLLIHGSSKNLFSNGTAADINTLFGFDNESNKTRVSIIYLNTLNTEEEKEFFIASIAQLLYNWMLKNPCDEIQGALFIDEIAPYIPPVKRPQCKNSLELLFRQGRKYGISCIIATQSPGDIDYKSIGQFSTFAIGALYTKQDINKIKTRLESLAPKEIDFIIQKIPSLKKGQFLIVSPEQFDSVQTVKFRWLYTQHIVLSEESISDLDVIKQYKKRVLKDIIAKDIEESIIEEIEYTDIIPDTDNNDYTDTVQAIELKIFERDLYKKVKPYLKGFIIKRESLDIVFLEYMSIVKINAAYNQDRDVSLYMDYHTMQIVHVHHNRIQFDTVIDKDPDKIISLDHISTIDNKLIQDIDFYYPLDYNERQIIKSIQTKYRIVVSDMNIVLFPVWKCVIKSNKTNNKRTVLIDGIIGKEIIDKDNNKEKENIQSANWIDG